MIAVGLSTLEKNYVLLSSVEMQIQTDPMMFNNFLSALSEDTSMRALVESMQSKCFIGKNSLLPSILRFKKGADNSLSLQSKELRKSVVMRQTLLSDGQYSR